MNTYLGLEIEVNIFCINPHRGLTIGFIAEMLTRIRIVSLALILDGQNSDNNFELASGMASNVLKVSRGVYERKGQALFFPFVRIIVPFILLFFTLLVLK